MGSRKGEGDLVYVCSRPHVLCMCVCACVCMHVHVCAFIKDNCGTANEVDSRICKASEAFHSLCRILWYQCKLKTCNMLRIFNAVVLPTLFYGLESLVFHEP